MNNSTTNDSTLDEPPRRTLLEISTRYGTPAYAFDQRRIRFQAEKLKTSLPDAVKILYSLKANASLGISDVIADCGLGADVASAGELVTAVEAGFSPQRIFVAGPYKSPETISLLRSLPEAIISIDSRSELKLLASEELPNRAVIRLRPDFESSAVVVAGPDCRFGVPPEELPECREEVASSGINVIGFHVFAGSQVLDAAGVIGHMQGAINLSLRAADILDISLEFINLGGGFGIPYKSVEEELWLAPIGEELDSLIRQVAPARMALELGRYLVAQAGWYLTSVVGHQTHQGREAVIVDGGTHQRADMCGLGLRTQAAPPLVLNAADGPLSPTDVLGCLSLPADVMAEAALLPSLAPGNVLAFANAGAYGMWSSPAMFHAYPLPAEFAFDGTTIEVMRSPQPARSILDGQNHVIRKELTVDSP
jgi:diaminopimelate decarboxylase